MPLVFNEENLMTFLVEKFDENLVYYQVSYSLIDNLPLKGLKFEQREYTIFHGTVPLEKKVSLLKLGL